MAENNLSLKAVVVSVSDTRREENDLSGVTLIGLLIECGAEIIEKRIVSDDFDELRLALLEIAGIADVNLILTTGGTGLAARDHTPEATKAVIEKEVPGIAEAMRIQTLKNTPTAMLSRGVCGVINQTLIVNLPGSPNGVQECFAVIKPILQHAVNQIGGITKH